MNLMEWVRAGRIHTASLTMPLALIGYVYGGGSDWVKGLLWLVFGLIFHYSGFLQNNVHDYMYDLKDPHKQHFPLVRGTIKLKHAFIVAYTGIIGVSVIPFILGGIPSLSVYIFGTLIPGTIYNLFSKKTLLKPIPISICFPTIPLASYLSASPVIDIKIIVLVLTFVATMLYQIGYSGELKDIDRAEKNILRSIGSTKWVAVYAIAIKTSNILIAAYLLYLNLDGLSITNMVIIGMFVITTVAIAELLYQQTYDYIKWTKHSWDRNQALKNMSFMEIFSYILIIVASANVLGILYAPLWIILPILWFITFNRVIFGTKLFPKV